MQSNGSIPLVDESVRTYFCPENHYNDMATLFFNSQEEAIKQLFHQEGNIISTIPCHIYILPYNKQLHGHTFHERFPVIYITLQQTAEWTYNWSTIPSHIYKLQSNTMKQFNKYRCMRLVSSHYIQILSTVVLFLLSSDLIYTMTCIISETVAKK